jgi:hypothetical protein
LKPNHFCLLPSYFYLPKVLDAASRFVASPGDDALKEQSARLEAVPLIV